MSYSLFTHNIDLSDGLPIVVYQGEEGVDTNRIYNYRSLITVANDTLVITPKDQQAALYQTGLNSLSADPADFSLTSFVPEVELPTSGGGEGYEWSDIVYANSEWQATIWHPALVGCAVVEMDSDFSGTTWYSTESSYIRKGVFDSGFKLLGRNFTNGRKRLSSFPSPPAAGTFTDTIIGGTSFDWWFGGVKLAGNYFFTGLGSSAANNNVLAWVNSSNTVTAYDNSTLGVLPGGNTTTFSDTNGAVVFLPIHASSVSATLTFNKYLDTDGGTFPTNQVTEVFSENVRNGNIAYNGSTWLMYAIPCAARNYILYKTSVDGSTWSAEKSQTIPTVTRELLADAVRVYDEIKYGSDGKYYFSLEDNFGDVLIMQATLE